MTRVWIRWTGYRSPLGKYIDRYITVKRALGRRFGNEERALRLLDRFLADIGIRRLEDITPDIMDTFLKSRPRASARSYNHLLGVVRRLLDWLTIQGVPGIRRYSGKNRREAGRRIPVLLADSDARQLLEAATRLPDDRQIPHAGWRGATFRTVFAILYTLGLRVGEVARIELADVDLNRRVLAVRRTKFGKDRLVPFGPRLAEVLDHYIRIRRRCWPDASAGGALFSLRGRAHISTNSIRRVFAELARESQLRPSASGSAPRVHDMRHSFAVATLLSWYRQGINPTDRLHHLSTFLGHVNPQATAVYLTITWELLDEAQRRFGAVARLAIPEVQ